MKLYKVNVVKPSEFAKSLPEKKRLVLEKKHRLVLSKAKKMPIGTIATWDGKKYRKVTDSQWEPVKEGGSEKKKDIPVGTVKTVKGKKYKKHSDGRWYPVKD